MPADLTPFARKLRREETPAEQTLWRALRRKQIGRLKFRRQHLVHGRIADFACPAAMLIIELDGAVHDDADAQTSDERRTKALEVAGWRVIRFRNRR
jgi:very-short-patch-repair endonuclease